MEFDLNPAVAGRPEFVPKLAVEPAGIAGEDPSEPLATPLGGDECPQDAGLVLAGLVVPTQSTTGSGGAGSSAAAAPVGRGRKSPANRWEVMRTAGLVRGIAGSSGSSCFRTVSLMQLI